MDKIYFSEKTGSIYWLEEGVLMSAPLPNNDGIIYVEDEGYEVDSELLKGDEIIEGVLAEKFFANIIIKL